MGHPIDKIELLVLGGTWSSYPARYQEWFINQIYYGANTYNPLRTNNEMVRPMKSLEEEMKENELFAQCKIIGLTLETRPDRISPQEIIRFRQFGVTRVQIGVQHTNERILRRVNRGCYNRHVIKAIRLLKDNCFKVDIHLMPDLP